MAKIPKGAKVEFGSARQPLPRGAAVAYDGPTPEEAAAMPRPKPTKLERLAEYIKSRPAAIADSATSPKFAQSFASGHTLGVVPYLSAAVDAAPEVLRAVTGNPADVGGKYTRALDRIKGGYDAAEKAEPVAHFAGQATSPNLAGKSTAGARLLSAGAQSGIEAATHDGNALEAALAGGGVQSATEAVSPVLGKISSGLRTTAGTAAANAAGLRGGIVNQAKRAGIPSLDAAGEAAIPKLGNRMLDEGLIPFGGSKLAVQRRAEKMMGEAGNAAEAIRTRADMAGSFDSAAGADAAARRLAAKVDPTQGGNLQTARAAGRAEDFVSDARNTPGTFRDADNLKRGAYGNTNWSTEAPDAAKLKRTAVSGYRQSIEDQVDALLPGEGKALHDINSKYGLAAQTADFAEEAAGREAANQKMGWGSMMLSATGAGAGAQFGTGAAMAGASLPVAAHLAKTRGAAVGAHLARGGSNVAAGAGKMNQSPAVSATVGNALEDYLRPKDDEQRQEEGAAWFTSATGRAGRR